MKEFVLNGLVKRRASVTRAPKPRKINEQKNRAAGASLGPPTLRHSPYAAPELIAPHSYTNDAFVYKRGGENWPGNSSDGLGNAPGVGRFGIADDAGVADILF